MRLDMSVLFTLLSRSLYLDLPQSLAGRLVAAAAWLLFLGLLSLMLLRMKGYEAKQTRQVWLIFAALAILTPLTSLFVGIRFSANSFLSPPGLPVEPREPSIMIFAALPWILASGFLGPLQGASLAALSGLLLALWDTHNPFTPLELALLGALFSAAVHQRYRTRAYRLLRHPFLAGVLLSCVYPLVALIDTVLVADGALASRLDYALAQLTGAALSVGVPVLIAVIFAEVVAAALPSWWDRNAPLQPSPAERSLEARFLYGMAPLAAILVLALMVGGWYVAGNAARQMLHDRLATGALTAAQGVPYFLESGQNLLAELAEDPDLLAADPAALSQTLAEGLRKVPFFNQLFFLDESGHSLAGYPLGSYTGIQAPTDEQMGVQLALNGVPFQIYTVPAEEPNSLAQVSFLATVLSSDGQLRGILIGRADLASNPFTQPILAALRSLEADGGEGVLLDEKGRILYHPNRSRVMTSYAGQRPVSPAFFDEAAPDGTRRLVFFQPVEGRPWAVVMALPAQRAQQLALNIAAPLLGMIFLFSLIAMLLVRLGLRVVTASLQKLAVEAGRISQGQLDHPLSLEGEDEVGQLGQAFEGMRLSLKARLDELNRLLLVSQGVASTLEFDEAIRPVLESAIRIGACSARVVLSPAVVPNLEEDGESASFGAGPASGLYSDLDDQILGLTQQQERILLTSLSRARLITFAPGAPRPGALLALALRHENLFYGALWVAYDEPHNFQEDEIRFLTTLAGQAALAAANARLFRNAEIGRQRLAAILASTPDPVLVTDQQNRLLLANPAAWRVLGLGIEWEEGQPIENILSQPEVLSLFRSDTDEKQSVELNLPDERIYYTTVSPVLAEGDRVGRVCVLRDITYFKDLDTLKSEFVATVSHDLRSPLTLMRGYATMLEMVGELNEQQVNYVRKIVTSVESMSRLVSNLLDLGRIEAGIDLQLELVPVRDVIERVIGALQLQATQKRVQVLVDVSENTMPLFDADGALLQQALHNLVENAIKYTEAGGKTVVRVEARGDRMIFMVSDTGIGIAPVDQPHLFEKFYRGAQSSKGQRGTGLGLAIVKSIVERHGGQISVESQLGKGSTFFLSFPLRQQNKAAERTARRVL